ncbi:MAG: hypothetical protein U0350_39855 [Caldilineaceae bacterium]
MDTQNEQMLRRSEEAYAMALGNAFLLHYLLKRLAGAELRDTAGQRFDVTQVFQQARQALTDEAEGRGEAWRVALYHLERMQGDW